MSAHNEIRVMAEPCATCIFRPGNLMSLHPGRVRSMVATCRRQGGFIPCHQYISERGGTKAFGKGTGAICRGFYDLPQPTQAVQLAQRLPAMGLAVLVEVQP